MQAQAFMYIIDYSTSAIYFTIHILYITNLPIWQKILGLQQSCR